MIGLLCFNKLKVINHKKMDFMFKAFVLKAAQKKGIDPYKQWRPRELGINSSKWGSCSDRCVNGSTKSSKYHPEQCLMPVKFNKAGRPTHYILI